MQIAIGQPAWKTKETQLWYILSIIGTAVLTVMIVFIINYAISGQYECLIRFLENTNLGQKSYSRDYQLTDDLSICVSLLDDSSGYAEYDTYDGRRIGTLLLPNDQISVDNLELKIADANSDLEK